MNTPNLGIANMAAPAAPAAAQPGTSPASVETQGNPAGAPAAAPAERPAWLPEGIESGEHLAKAYLELAGKSAPKVDIGAVQERFVANGGKFADEDIKSFEAAGFSREHLDTYAKGLAAHVTEYRSQVFQHAGGEANYAAAVQWAAKNLPPEEQAAFDSAVNSMDPAQAKVAVEGLVARFRLKVGHDPRMASGKPATGAPTAFRSAAEMKTALMDPKYRTDDAFRADVDARILASPF